MLKNNNEMPRQTQRNRWFYATGGIGRDMAAAGLFLNYLLPYVLITKRLSQHEFLGLTAVMVGGRLLEAILDPLMGSVLDRVTTPWGKFKPWLLLGTLGTGLVVVLSFTNSWQAKQYLLAFVVLYFGFDIFFTMNDVTYWAMLPALSSDASERNRLASLSTLMAGIGAFLTNLLVPLLTIGPHAWGGNAISGYAHIAVVFVLILFFCQGLVIVGVQERSLQLSVAPKVQGLWRQIFCVFQHNDQIRWNAWLLFIYMSTSTFSTLLWPFYFYLTFGYSGTWQLFFSLPGQLALAGLYIVFDRLAARYSRLNLIRWATQMSVVGYLLLWLGGACLPIRFPILKISLLALANSLPTLGSGICLLVVVVNIANTVEYQQLLTGKRHEGILFSVRPFMTKVGMAVGQLFGMLFFAATGLLFLTQRIAKLERLTASQHLSQLTKQTLVDHLLQVSSPLQQKLVLTLATLVPLLGILSFNWFYRHYLAIDEKRYLAICQLLKKGTQKSD